MRLIPVFLLLSLLMACKTEKQRALPYIGNYDIEYKTVNGQEVADTIYPKVAAFSMRNQDSVLINSDDLKGKIWIADFFFTSCPTICPAMTSQMKRVLEGTEDIKDHVYLLSFSINPKQDQPQVLRAYRRKYEITAKNWHFLTGNEAKTHVLGIESFQIFAGQDEEAEGGYAHSPAFSLVDKEGYIRGVYVGTDPEQVDQLIKDVHRLIEIEYPND